MSQTNIPPESWKDFFDDFGRLHHGWLVTVGIVDTELLDRSAEARAHVVSEQEPLHEIRSEEGGKSLAIVTGRGTNRITHNIRCPTRLLVERSSLGADESLRIDDQSGHTTLINFRSTVLPETLDGLSEEELR